jgi:hypothetical protein
MSNAQQLLNAAVALIGAAWLSGCAPVLQMANNAIPPRELKLSMPEFRHKVVDAETKQPIKGLLVYGYAETYSGTIAGGNGTRQQVRTFEVLTDENGDFILPAWEQTVTAYGEPEQRFPTIAMWKPGYKYTQYSGGSLYGFAPNLPEAVRSYYGGNWKDKGPAMLDVRDRPTLLPPAKTLRERFDAYLGSGTGASMRYPCGFNDFPRLLVVQHYEWKALISEIVPAAARLPSGEIRGDFRAADNYFDGQFGRDSSIERLKNWTCPTHTAAHLLNKFDRDGKDLK